MQTNGVATIHPGITGAVFEGAANLGNVANGDYGVARCFDWNAQNIPRILNNARHFDGKTPLTIVETARWNQPIVAHDTVDDLIRRELISFQNLGVDDGFHQLFTLADHVRRQNAVLSFDGVPQIQSNVVEHSLRHISDEVDLQNWEFRCGLFLDDGLFSVCGKFHFCSVHGFAGI